MSDRFQALQVFVRAAESGSFSAAARELGLSQPSVSRIVSELESKLGVKLLLRTTRKVVPTDAGDAFLQRARQVLVDLEEAETSARHVDSLHGVLRVALPSVLCNRVLLPNLGRFMREHPWLKVELLTSDDIQDLVAEGVDVAIRFGRLKDSGFGARKLATLPRMLAASPAYLAARGAPDGPDSLGQHDIIVGPANAMRWPWTFARDGLHTSVEVRPRYLLASAESAIVCAREGLGIVRAAVPMMAAELSAGQLVPVLPGYTLDPVEVHAVYPAGRLPSQKARSFTSCLAALLASGDSAQAAT